MLHPSQAYLLNIVKQLLHPWRLVVVLNISFVKLSKAYVTVFLWKRKEKKRIVLCHDKHILFQRRKNHLQPAIQQQFVCMKEQASVKTIMDWMNQTFPQYCIQRSHLGWLQGLVDRAAVWDSGHLASIPVSAPDQLSYHEEVTLPHCLSFLRCKMEITMFSTFAIDGRKVLNETCLSLC